MGAINTLNKGGSVNLQEDEALNEMAKIAGDLKAAITWAGKNGGDLKKVAVTGFCWGGRITWLSNTRLETA